MHSWKHRAVCLLRMACQSRWTVKLKAITAKQAELLRRSFHESEPLAMMTKQKMKAAANLVSRSHLVAFGFSIFLLLPPLVFAAEDRSEGNNLELQGAAASEPAVGTDGGAPTA